MNAVMNAAERTQTVEHASPGGFEQTMYHVKESPEGPTLKIEKFNLWYGKAQALHDVTMDVQKGLVTALIGPSGCGKSTLLRCFNRMNDLIDELRIAGKMQVGDQDIYRAGLDVIALRKRMGMVFQKPNPFAMSIFDNVIYPMRVDGVTNRAVLEETCERALRGAALWDEVKDRLKESALGLSGGQQQRLCIARAIVSRPALVLADEPTANLDEAYARDIMDMFRAFNEVGVTLLISTHDHDLIRRYGGRNVQLAHGRLMT